MRYRAEALTVVACQSSAQAIILSEAQAKSRSLAMRHARAMLEVQRAAKALARSFRKSKPLPPGYVPDGFARLTRAVAKLEAVEKEVRRG